MAALLELDGLSKSYGALKVIDDLSVRLEDGEALGVVGPNGAGKTTMLHLAAGQLRPDAGGSAWTAGRHGLPARARCHSGCPHLPGPPAVLGDDRVRERPGRGDLRACRG